MMEGKEKEEKIVLCASSRYSKKFYISEEFSDIPDQIKRELKIMCVLFTEDVGGVLEILYDKKGDIHLRTISNSDDYFYDEIGSEYKMRKMRNEKQELFQSLRLYYRVMKLGISPSEAALEIERGLLDE